ncbi:MAG: DUF1615 domain-containing protein [Pseudomonadota bacterium]|nr:DUF1615 domain-containing protein [Pseudomonadota bacterium]
MASLRCGAERWTARWLPAALLVAAALFGCATPDTPVPSSGYRPLSASEGRALIVRLLPDSLADRGGWATDIFAAVAALDIPPTVDNFCAIIAVTEQESGFRADPAVPGLAAIAWREIEKERERAGIPRLVLDAALALPSPTGKSYRERIDAVRTELQLSDVFDDFIGMVPLARRFLADRNPVRTGGPMQVGVAFAESHLRSKPYPYALTGSVRREVFTRRGGVYFGTAHLLGYAASYERYLYRFADFNAGWYASRNAAFQNAVTQLSGIPLSLDGDVLRYADGAPANEPSSTELAVRVLARRIGMGEAEIRHDLERGKTADFDRTRLYQQVFALADRASGRLVPRAVLPDIRLQSPKITRELTTEWFANRVERRFQACRARVAP